MSSFNYRVPALVLLAQVQVKQQKLAEAAATLDGAQKEVEAKKLEYPPLFFYARGDILARMNQSSAAVTAFREEIRRYPHDRQAYAALAVLYLLTGRRNDANATMEKLVAANPSRDSYRIAVETFTELGDKELVARWKKR